MKPNQCSIFSYAFIIMNYLGILEILVTSKFHENLMVTIERYQEIQNIFMIAN